MQALNLLCKYRKVLWATSINDIRGRYTGTFFGSLWSVLYPLMFLSLYSIVFTMVFKVRVEGTTTFSYILLIFAGLIPFLGFSEVLGTGVSSVVSNKNLIKNTLFPIELIPVKAVFTSSVHMCVGLALLLTVLWYSGTFNYSQFLVPLLLILQWLFSIGLIWLLSALNVFFRDISQVISIIILFLMLISPIAYTPEMVPEKLKLILYLNPLYYLIMLYRKTLVEGIIPIDLLLTFSLIAFALFFFGYFVFFRLKPLFGDYV